MYYTGVCVYVVVDGTEVGRKTSSSGCVTRLGQNCIFEVKPGFSDAHL